MINTNRIVGVVFPISICVRELESRSTKNVRERDEDGWEGRRKVSEGGELGEYSIWQGGESVVVEGMNGMRV